MIDERWRHARVAFVLGSITVIALGLIAFVLTTSRGTSRHAAPPMLLTEVPSSSASTSSSRSIAATTTPKSTTPTTTSAAPSSRVADVRTTVLPGPAPARSTGSTSSAADSAEHRDAGPCRNPSPCALGGDVQVPAALTAYRRGHGQPGAVHGDVTSAAQQCAVSAGDGATCRQPFAIARESGRDGRRVIADIGAGDGNWLLDPQLGSVEVGWAYQPRSGQYVCAILERS